jgi:hypothetical protein
VIAELVRYDAMCRAIEEAHAVDEVKDIRDRAAALEQYQRQAHNIDAERNCCLIRLRAERKVGQLLKEMADRGERESRGRRDQTSQAATLTDLGISRTQSSRWQGLAEIPQGDFEAALAEPGMPTTSGILEKAKPKELSPVASDALWLWGRLCDVERRGLLQSDQTAILNIMTEPMREDVSRLAPMVAEWLTNIGGAP